MEKIMYILRGVPGSGKTTFAKTLTKWVFESDNYFMDEEGNYNFCENKLSDAHKWCVKEVEMALEKGLDKIAISNTNIEDYSLVTWIKLAQKWGYKWFIVKLDGGYKNIHGVSDEKVDHMRKRMELPNNFKIEVDKDYQPNLKDLEDLESRGYINRNYNLDKDLIIWNYTKKTEIDRYWNNVTLSARGLITDLSGNIVARPFCKFFNYEEIFFNENLSSDPLLNDDIKVYEKLDGSLGIIFYWKGKWNISTKGSFNSEQSIKATKILNNKDLSRLDKNFTYIGEIIYPDNRVVVDYGDKSDIILTGVIRTLDGKEFTEYLDETGFEYLKPLDIESDWYSLRGNFNGNNEGYVVISNGIRVKLKFTEYFDLHRVFTNLSSFDIWESISGGETFESFVTKHNLPDELFTWANDLWESLYSEWERISNRYKKEFDTIKSKYVDIKDFALNYENRDYDRDIFFKMFKENDLWEKGIWEMVKPKRIRTINVKKN